MEREEKCANAPVVHSKLSEITSKSPNETNVPISSIGTMGNTPNETSKPDTNIIHYNNILPLLSQLQSCDMTNGDPTTIIPLKFPISSSWHWQPIEGLPTDMAEKYTNMFIRVALATFAHTPPNNTNEAQRRKLAIVVGVARATTTAFYGITTDDLMPEERMNSWLSATQTTPGEYTFTIAEGVPTVARAILEKDLGITSEEQEIIAAARMSAIGLLPVQGYSLITTSHHYLSDPKSESGKAFSTMEIAFWNMGVIKNWWTTNTDIARDALWHKAMHPVNIKVKMQLALDEALPARLCAAGAGAAATRLPAVEPEMRKAKHQKTLLEICKPMFETVGGSLDFSKLSKSIDMVNCFAPMSKEDTVPRERLPEGTPTSVKGRASALKNLAGVMDRNKDKVAYCYGFYMALQDHKETFDNTSSKGLEWLKHSFSLKKLRDSNYPSFVAGVEYFSDYKAAINKVHSSGRTSS